MKSAGRILLFLLAGVVYFSSNRSPVIGHAQDQATNYTQNVTAIYGTKLTFGLEATATSDISQPELVIAIEHRTSEFRRIVSDVAPAISVRVSQAITPEELELPPYSVLRYWWEWNQGDGQRVSTEPVLMLYEDTAVPWVWQVTQQGNVVIHAQDVHANEANQAAAFAVEAQHELSLLVGAETQEPLHIYIYPELAQLAGALRLHGIQVQDWVAAYALPDQRVSFVALGDGPSRVQSLQEDVSHEVGHLVIGIEQSEFSGQVPAWYNEGAALSLAKQPDSTLSTMLADLDQEATPDFRTGEKLCESSFTALPPHEAALAYAHSVALFRYIQDRYGASQLQGLLTAYSDGVSCLDAFNLVLGISFQSLYDQWRGDLNRSAPETTDDNNLSTWILGWGVSLMVALLFLAPLPVSKAEASGDAYSTKLRLSQIDDQEG